MTSGWMIRIWNGKAYETWLCDGRHAEWVCWPVLRLWAACAGTGEGNDGRNGVRIVSGAYPDRGNGIRGWRTNTTGKPSRGVVGGRCAPGGGFCGWGTCGRRRQAVEPFRTWWPMAVSSLVYVVCGGCPRSARCRAVFTATALCPVSGRVCSSGMRTIRCSFPPYRRTPRMLSIPKPC